MILKNIKFKKNINISEEKIDNKSVCIFNPENNNTYILNSTASFIWQNCEGTNLDDIIDLLLENYQCKDYSIKKYPLIVKK